MNKKKNTKFLSPLMKIESLRIDVTLFKNENESVRHSECNSFANFVVKGITRELGVRRDGRVFLRAKPPKMFPNFVGTGTRRSSVCHEAGHPAYTT